MATIATAAKRLFCFILSSRCFKIATGTFCHGSGSSSWVELRKLGCNGSQKKDEFEVDCCLKVN